ncbi:MAG: DNA adenine methylase [Chloroflexi bacterium]|nr:DNA adenine methylase [Chloroflexota bacterium]
MNQLGFWEVEVPPKVVNVASVPQRSPFRYPGGKTWLVPRARQWLRSLPSKPKKFIEPFAGGAITGLTVAFESLADFVILVEKDEQVAAVWQTIINTDDGAEWLANKIINFKLTPESARLLISSQSNSSRDLAFKTIIQNRVSHGGILADGAGILKNGEKGKGILSRWYPATLKRRILDISKVRENLKFIKGDGFQTIKKYSGVSDVVYFVDPPYTASKKKAGARLYKYHQVDHAKLFELMSKAKGDFLMTYDDADEVRALALKYRFETRLVAMTNTHNTTMTELLIGRDLNWVDKL